MPHFARRTGMSFLANPDKIARAQDEAAFGSPFLWFLSFGEAKERNSSVGTRTHIQITVALATQNKQPAHKLTPHLYTPIIAYPN